MAEINSKQLREERAKVAKLIKDLADKANAENREFASDEQETWTKLNTDYDTFTSKIAAAERNERAEQVISEQRQAIADRSIGRNSYTPEDNREVGNIAFNAWCRSRFGKNVDARGIDAMQRCNVNPQSREYVITLPAKAPRTKEDIRELRTSSGQSTTNNLGGYSIPIGFVAELEQALLAYGGMMQVARIMRTDSGNLLHWPTVNDTSNKGALLAEATAVTTLDVPFSEIQLSAYKFQSKQLLVSAELTEDSAFDLSSELGNMLGVRLARALNDYATTGTGSSEPKGILTAATSGLTSASASAISADEIKTLIASVDPMYRQGAQFMMHDSILWYLRKLKDGNGRYLLNDFINNFAGPDANSLLGYPVVVNQSMTGTTSNVPTTGSKHVLFGQLSKFVIRLVRQVRLYHLQERYRDTDQDGFIAFIRMDSNLLDAGTHPVKFITQA